MMTFVRAACSLGLIAGLAACASPTVPSADIDARLPTEQFRAEVADEPHELALAVHAGGLSANQAAALTSFASDWHLSGGAPVQIQAPDEPAARRFGEEVRQHLALEGIPPGAIRMVGSNERGVMTVGFLRRVAVVPECGTEWTNFRRSMNNKVSPNFGCSVTANVAVQIADPSDLLGPRPTDPVDAGRKTTIIERYRQGSRTGGAIDSNASGAVSSAVQ